MRPTRLAVAKEIHAWATMLDLLFVSGQRMIALFFATPR
jgi:hypothetical protein